MLWPLSPYRARATAPQQTEAGKHCEALQEEVRVVVNPLRDQRLPPPRRRVELNAAVVEGVRGGVRGGEECTGEEWSGFVSGGTNFVAIDKYTVTTVI